jgi:hypothetical protein
MNVDAIYVITITGATERHQKILEWYPNDAGIQLFKVERDTSNPKRGCFESHQKIISVAKKHGHSKILIMEDDAFPILSWVDIVSRTNKLLSQIEFDPKWKYLMLGSLPFRTRKTKFDELLEVICALEAHAYIVNLKNVTPVLWNGDHVDVKMFCDFNKETVVNDSGILFRFLNKNDSHVYLSRQNLFRQQTQSSYINQLHIHGRTLVEKIFHNYDNMIEMSLHTNILLFIICMAIIIILLFILIPVIFLSNKNVSQYYCIFISVIINVIISLLLIENRSII